MVRNRIRRRLRSVFAEIDMADDQVIPPGTYLVSASSDAATMPYEDLMATTRKLLDEVANYGACR